MFVGHDLSGLFFSFIQMETPAFNELVKSRHSVRKFKPDPIPDAVLTSIVETAKMTPSWCNHQPWNVIIATGETLEKLRGQYIKLTEEKAEPVHDLPYLHRTDVSAHSLKCMTEFFEELDGLGTQLHDEFWKLQAHFFNAPAVVFFTLPKNYSIYSILDVGAFTMTFMLAARAHGVDSVPAASTLQFTNVLHEVLSVPDDQAFLFGIPIGYAADDILNQFVPKRAPVSEFLTIKH